MTILAVDSCSCVATGAILREGILAAEFVINDKKTHSVKLLPQIENMLTSVDMTYNDIDCFAVTVGPGSFTGQRIGTATVKALAHAVNKPIIGVSSLEAMAYNVPFFDGLICPIMDARREQVYTATYKFVDGQLVTINSDRAIALAELLNEIKNEKVIFTGDGVPVFSETIKQTLGDNAYFAPPHLLHLRGGSVAMCAYNKQETPMYLRMSQAERELKSKA